jgi:hypothetical protein
MGTFCTCTASSLLFWNYLLILTILPVIRFKDPNAAIWHWRCIQEAAFDFVKSYPEATSDKIILATGRSALETNHRAKNFEEGILKISE